MAFTQRAAAIATSALAIVGIWVYFVLRKRRVTSNLEQENCPAIDPKRASKEGSPSVVLTQSSDEGKQVSVLHEGESNKIEYAQEQAHSLLPNENLESKFTESEQSSDVSLQNNLEELPLLSNNNQSSLHTKTSSELNVESDSLHGDDVNNINGDHKLESSTRTANNIEENDIKQERCVTLSQTKENVDLNSPFKDNSKSEDVTSECSHSRDAAPVEQAEGISDFTGNVLNGRVTDSDSAQKQSQKRSAAVHKSGGKKQDDNSVKRKDTARGIKTQQNSQERRVGSQSVGAASPEQCHSSDSGVSVQSEPEVSVNGSNTASAKLKAQEVEVFEFDFPTNICGMLIGAKGKTIKRLMERSGATITVKRKVYDQDHQVISVRGKPDEIKTAMKMIKDKFPMRKFGVDYSASKPEHPILSPDLMQLCLPEGVPIDVIVSSVVTANHVFLQQPTHPSFHLLQRQNDLMAMCYNNNNTVPELPRPIEVGVICAAPMYNGWYRSQVVQAYPENDECDIRFVDYGGYMKAQGNAIKQIRSDFTQLPFQAVECYLAHVIPPQGKQEFSVEANAVLEQMVQGQVLQAEVVGHESDGVPYVQLYLVNGEQIVFVNRELVNKGVARWVEMSACRS